MEDNQESILRQGLADLDLALNDNQIARLLAYLELLRQWNKAYNLTAVTGAAEMVRLHLLDSLAIMPRLRGNRFIDVGTGAGLPGIPLAIAMPDRHFTLLDSNGKRVRFLFQVKVALGLTNIAEVHARVESYCPGDGFDGVISRAFTSLSEMIAKTRHLLARNGVFYAMKGRYPEKELSELEKPYNVLSSHRLEIPGVAGERHLIEIGNFVLTGAG